MRTKFIFISVFSIFALRCHQSPINVEKAEQVPIIESFRINVDSTHDYINLKLSEIADSFEIVRIETSKNAIINANDYYVSGKNIVAFSQDGIYKFSSDGKFQKKIISWGRGPDDISGFMSYFYDEKNDLIYFDDSDQKSRLLVYDLNLDKFVSPINKAIEGFWGSFAIINDSLILGKSPSYSANPFAIYFQTFNGKFVSGIPNIKKRLLGSNPNATHQPVYLCIAKDTYRISYELDDTLFTLKNNKLIPYITFDFKIPREKIPNARNEKGDRTISFPKVEPSSFLIIGVSVIDEITWETPTAGRSKSTRKYFFLNKSTGKHSIIKTYEDDISGEIQLPGENRINFPLFLKNGKAIVVYQPSIIKKIAETIQTNSILTQELKDEIIEINKTLQETDNPVLLIGKIKNKI
jgi:hypothetical protein